MPQQTSLPARATEVARSSVASSASDVLLVAASGDRLSLSVYNDSSADLYLAAGTAAASTSSYTVKLAAGAYFEAPAELAQVEWRAIWGSANGNARVTTSSGLR